MITPAPSQPAFPRALAIGIFALVVVTVTGVATARFSGYKPSYEVAATLSSRELRFADQDDGGIRVTDAADGQVIGTVAPGGDGFLRATMRGLATARKLRGSGPDIPFLLAARVDGSLTLQDPATGRTLDLAAFGPTNAAAFARFLPAASRTASS